MTKAFAYLRVSGRAQVEGDGFDRQLAAIEKHAAANNIEIVQVFREEGVSGTTDWEIREAFVEMMAEVMADGVRTILIERLDRLARDLMVQESIITDFRKKDIQLISVYEPDLCSDDPSRVLMRQIFGAIAQYDKAMIVAKLRVARVRNKAKNGRCEGAKPFGHYNGEAEILQQIAKMRLTGMEIKEIAVWLNRNSVPTRSGKPWNAAVLARILRRDRVTPVVQ
jgi:DNA invertase Pin-like site-specific DNA recombinase